MALIEPVKKQPDGNLREAEQDERPDQRALDQRTADQPEVDGIQFRPAEHGEARHRAGGPSGERHDQRGRVGTVKLRRIEARCRAASRASIRSRTMRASTAQGGGAVLQQWQFQRLDGCILGAPSPC
ncbi:hypothetical protein [Cereibacter sphaeroides]|uniref:hypothetical protein n=1 Tax=Cereibacter sphaeroides TaxID=1063 RepID=UPI0011AE6CAC|nr:hypothetical protein [Cereibacter sphaeroides]